MTPELAGRSSIPQCWWGTWWFFCCDSGSAGPAIGLGPGSFQHPSCRRRAPVLSLLSKQRSKSVLLHSDFINQSLDSDFISPFPHPIYFAFRVIAWQLTLSVFFIKSKPTWKQWWRIPYTESWHSFILAGRPWLEQRLAVLLLPRHHRGQFGGLSFKSWLQQSRKKTNVQRIIYHRYVETWPCPIQCVLRGNTVRWKVFQLIVFAEYILPTNCKLQLAFKLI